MAMPLSMSFFPLQCPVHLGSPLMSPASPSGHHTLPKSTRASPQPMAASLPSWGAQPCLPPPAKSYWELCEVLAAAMQVHNTDVCVYPMSSRGNSQLRAQNE